MTTTDQWNALVEAHAAVAHYRRTCYRPAIADLNLYEFLLSAKKDNTLKFGVSVQEAFDLAVEKDFILDEAPEMWQYDQDRVIEFLEQNKMLEEEE